MAAPPCLGHRSFCPSSAPFTDLPPCHAGSRAHPSSTVQPGNEETERDCVVSSSGGCTGHFSSRPFSWKSAIRTHVAAGGQERRPGWAALCQARAQRAVPKERRVRWTTPPPPTPRGQPIPNAHSLPSSEHTQALRLDTALTPLPGAVSGYVQDLWAMQSPLLKARCDPW